MTVVVSEGEVRQEPKQKQAQSVAQNWYAPVYHPLSPNFLVSFCLDKC